jgi:cytochrome c oxidase subunit 3
LSERQAIEPGAPAPGSPEIPASEALALRGQFSTPEQQRQTGAIGMWIFLATEILFFGGLFAAFSVYRFAHFQAFDRGSADMNIYLGFINTAVLVISSFMMAMAIHSAQEGRSGAANWFLIATMLLGAAFLGIKAVEYHEHYVQYQVPGFMFRTNDPDPGGYEMFFVFYFIMTALHALHMVIGVGLLAWLLTRNLMGIFTREYHNPMVMTGLYWHFVDMVWLFLYAIFYLPGLHLIWNQ